jgi:methylmalonyl-CoA/ethylmalonyl-CoA epimerase
MVKNVEHIGIAVKNLGDSNKIFENLLGAPVYKTEEVLSENVTVSFLKAGDTKIELLQATNDQSPIAKFIEKKGEGLHHIAFEVDDIKRKMDELRQKGFRILSDEPKKGADNKLICFVHPADTNGVLIELCQEIR